MVTKKKPKNCQAQWFCMWLNRMEYATENGYSPDDNWLCSCSRWIKDDEFHHNEYHRLTPGIHPKNTLPTNPSLDMGNKQNWRVTYWDNSDKEHKTTIENCTQTKAEKQLNEARIKTWALFNEKGKNVKCGGQ